jgi:hypothetical protein
LVNTYHLSIDGRKKLDEKKLDYISIEYFIIIHFTFFQHKADPPLAEIFNLSFFLPKARLVSASSERADPPGLVRLRSTSPGLVG